VRLHAWILYIYSPDTAQDTSEHGVQYLAPRCNQILEPAVQASISAVCTECTLAPDSSADVDGTSSVTGTLPTVTIVRAALLGSVSGWSMRDSVAMTGHGSSTTAGGASCRV